MNIQRERDGKDFKYFKIVARNSVRITDEDTLKRIRHLRIAPAYTGVVISSYPKSKVQAYGYDLKGRKQTIYAKWFVQQQQKQKFAKVMGLESTIFEIQRNIDGILADYLRHTKERVASPKVQIALIVKLMFLCNFRIGSDNITNGEVKAYGLTTLEWNHVHQDLQKETLYFSFIGKKGVKNESLCSDKNIYKVVHRMYKSRKPKSKQIFDVNASDVNQYLQQYDGTLTSKDIRTWMANHLYVKYFMENENKDKNFTKRQKHAIERVAADLHHTPTVCRNSYIFPSYLM